MDASTGEDATRLCVGCKQTAAPSELLRLVACSLGPDGGPDVGSGGEPLTLVPDVRKRAPGRGVSVHPRFRCIETAVRTGAFKRALGVSLPQTIEAARELAATASEQYSRRVQGLIMAAQRSRRLSAGTEAVRDAINERKAQLLVIASDAEGSRGDLMAAAERLGRSCLFWNTKEGLGRLFGRATLSILAIHDVGIADELGCALRSLRELAEES